MITINTNNCNPISQNHYNDFIDSIDFHNLQCTCGHFACLTKHGYYHRFIKTYDCNKLCLSILRVKCSFCNKTHALFPVDIVPYSSISVTDHVSIINNYEHHLSQEQLMVNKPTIDESNISYIIRMYKLYWKQRLLSCSISLDASIFSICSLCICHFNLQFMQIKRCRNFFLDLTHIP